MIGYFKRSSHELVDIHQCPVLSPDIVEALPALRKLVRPLLSRKNVARLSVLSTHGGLDVVIDEVEQVDDASVRVKLVELCADLSFGSTYRGWRDDHRKRPSLYFL